MCLAFFYTIIIALLDAFNLRMFKFVVGFFCEDKNH